MKSDVADLPSGKCYAVEGAGQFGWCQVIKLPVVHLICLWMEFNTFELDCSINFWRFKYFHLYDMV